MQFEQDKVSSYYNSSSKPSFFFYRISIVASMVFLLAVLGVNLTTLNQSTSTTSRAANPNTENVSLPQLLPGCMYEKTQQGTIMVCPTHSPLQTGATTSAQALPPLPPQCHYEASATGNVVKCSEGGKNCTYTMVNNHYVMSCNK